MRLVQKSEEIQARMLILQYVNKSIWPLTFIQGQYGVASVTAFTLL